ncbi:DUF1822 family protein [Aliterella atlantica]|uniref:DUF1822 domain-containing protein n=1 Tax=Aliterella atlantica CENA595 TaxID=1618023 RepID=A0A0D8ZU07_9CYAN|nr:DUF1822 family protein [Aliterella atlantica]KJH71954.1 hypothetical protein UH38_09555 [Aliterella atlantica CENA595]
MMLSFDDLIAIDSDCTWLEFSQEDQISAWQQVNKQIYSHDAARWNAYQNYLCLNAFQIWLAAETDLQDKPKVWTQPSELPSFWEVVNGTVITLGKTRLALVPSETMNLEELRVQQEWVDIPTWAADYYLAIELNLAERWLKVLGYATHEQLKNEGKYDPMDRTVCLDRASLIEDLNVMWITRELSTSGSPAVKPLPSLSNQAAEALLDRLSQPPCYSPRLDVPFEQWAALIAHPTWRQHLYQRRSQYLISAKTPVNLSQWVQGIFTAGWQVVEELVSPTVLVPVARSANPIERAKQINLGEHSVALIVTRIPEDEPEVSILLQVEPTSDRITLPENLQLSAFDESGTVHREVRAKNATPFIELPRLVGIPGEQFSVKLSVGDFSITEDFVI